VFAHTIREGREKIIDLVARLLETGTRNPDPDNDFHMMAVPWWGPVRRSQPASVLVTLMSRRPPSS
jgi:hypothetical protein